jgi:hypothetical protein
LYKIQSGKKRAGTLLDDLKEGGKEVGVAENDKGIVYSSRKMIICLSRIGIIRTSTQGLMPKPTLDGGVKLTIKSGTGVGTGVGTGGKNRTKKEKRKPWLKTCVRKTPYSPLALIPLAPGPNLSIFRIRKIKYLRLDGRLI